jgi:hypothetical protein
MTPFPTRLAPVAAAAAVLLAGCGGDSSSEAVTTTTAAYRAQIVKARLVQPPGCFVTVFLADTATAAQKRRVERLLVTNPLVVRVAFVSKSLALRRFARLHPEIASNILGNLFPDFYEAVPRTRGSVFSIISSFAAGVDGITNAKASVACPRP